MLPTMKRVETNPGVVNPGKEVFKIEAGRQVQMSFVVASGIKFDRLEQAPSNTLVLSMASEAPLGENQTGWDLRIATSPPDRLGVWQAIPIRLRAKTTTIQLHRLR